MNLTELKSLISLNEEKLEESSFVVIHTFIRDERQIHVGITGGLRKKCRKGKVWKSKSFLTALKNADYGFDEDVARSRGGRDGIFLLDRDYKPRNTMQQKLFDQYLDKANSGLVDVLAKLDIKQADIKPIRLVSHHMRLLGILWQSEKADWLILVDYDDTKN